MTGWGSVEDDIATMRGAPPGTRWVGDDDPRLARLVEHLLDPAAGDGADLRDRLIAQAGRDCAFVALRMEVEIAGSAPMGRAMSEGSTPQEAELLAARARESGAGAVDPTTSPLMAALVAAGEVDDPAGWLVSHEPRLVAERALATVIELIREEHGKLGDPVVNRHRGDSFVDGTAGLRVRVLSVTSGPGGFLIEAAADMPLQPDPATGPDGVFVARFVNWTGFRSVVDDHGRSYLWTWYGSEPHDAIGRRRDVHRQLFHPPLPEDVRTLVLTTGGYLVSETDVNPVVEEPPADGSDFTETWVEDPITITIALDGEG